jgi:hypothetical protein
MPKNITVGKFQSMLKAGVKFKRSNTYISAQYRVHLGEGFTMLVFETPYRNEFDNFTWE